jgi:diguanylate cyclase (GGDEF)-like protein
MRARGTRQRLLGGAGTCLLLGVAALQISAASAPRAVLLTCAALVTVAAAAAALTLSIRLADRVKGPSVVLGQGLCSIAIAAAILSLLGPYLQNPVPLTVVTFLAVLLTINPATNGRVLSVLWIATLVALGFVWSRIGVLASFGAGGFLTGEALVGALPLLAYTNWSLTDRHTQNQTQRMLTIAEAARRVSAATTVADVVREALLACRETYPQTTWGGILVADPRRDCLTTLPVYLGPSGITPRQGHDVRIAPGEGVSGTVFASGHATLLPTRREIASAYAETSAEQTATLSRFGGGLGVASFIAAPMRSLEGRVTGVLVLNSHVREHAWHQDDVTVVQAIADQTAVALERARLYEQQHHRATTDALTGLNNRRAFDDLLRAPDPGPVAVLAIDVDNLKAINDQYGHEAGDDLLIRVATMLAGQARDGDVLARIGGDEFVAVLFGADAREATAVAERMRSSLRGVALPHGTAQVSIGVATGGPGSRLRTVWSQADSALAAAKRGGRDQVSGGERGASPHRRRRVQDMTDLLDAVFSNPDLIRPVFQPIVQIDDRTVVGYEALARLPLNMAGDSGVEDVFKAAHRLGRMRDLDWLCRRRALEGARHLPPDLPIFINVSAIALMDPVHPVDQMLLLARAARREPSTIVLDITERETFADKRRLRYVLASYREHGIQFAIDDVGEGHATLEVLAAAMPEYIKLAPAMTSSMADIGSRAAVEATVAFARESKSRVIAEGVERRDIAERAALAGVELGQGFYFGRPAPLDALRI